jgi:hypothetical protein
MEARLENTRRLTWLAFGALASLAAASCGDDENAARSTGSSGTTGSSGSAGTSGASGSSGAAGSDAGVDAAPSPNLSFRKLTLSTDFYCEGATFGDFDHDGVKDIVSGPFWYRGPDFSQKTQLYPPVLADPNAYSDNFFAFSPDLNADGWDDIIVVGFPGYEAWWFENPKTTTGSWTRHLIWSAVDTESPEYVDLTGDGRRELVFATGGQLVYAEPQADPSQPWTIQRVSPPVGFAPFTHGLGVGDVDGDGRADILEATGFWRQPATLGGFWQKQAQALGRGGAQMFATDVDRDGDRDVVTTIDAHHWGLSWFERNPANTFVEHVIVSPEEPTTGLVMMEPHALALADMNGDGREDLITGERFMGHPAGWDAGLEGPARLYWFESVPNGSSVTYVPHLVDDRSGIGTQVVAGDVSGDGLLDIVVGNKKGTFVFVQERSADGG